MISDSLIVNFHEKISRSTPTKERNADGNIPVDTDNWIPDQSETAEKWSRVRAYGFQLGNLNILAPIGVYCEIINDLQISSLPNSPKHFCGLVHVHGNIVPVYQVQTLLGMQRIKSKYAFLIGTSGKSAALLIEEKPVTVDFGSLKEVPFSKNDLHKVLHESISFCYQDSNEKKSGDNDSKNIQKKWFLLDDLAFFKSMAGLA